MVCFGESVYVRVPATVTAHTRRIQEAIMSQINDSHQLPESQRNRPSGTITFLFTDIEGSTKLWESNATQMRQALAVHDDIVRAALESHRGLIFKTMGDAFCAAFYTAHEAIEAAVATQLGLIRQDWRGSAPLRVRIAIHVGEADERNNDYFGPTVNRVARLLGAGSGQQTLITQSTYELVSGQISGALELQDLGVHRFRDLTLPENVWQVLHPELPRVFPPLKSLDYLPTNLPVQLTSFIGREKEMAEITKLLSGTRLLTLTGSGGTGKTRLSLHAAANVLDRHSDGVWLVELAPLSNPELVPGEVAKTLGVRETPGEPITKTLISWLKSKQLLLVLDNCEHVLEASARLVNDFLKSCPNVSVLVSSREALGMAGEQTYRVPSLSAPDIKQPQTPESLSRYDSVRLFVDRATAARSDFTVNAENVTALASACHRLDGIPLAIELAAARVRMMPVEQIEARLDSSFRLLTGGSRTALPRQQTLRALIDWSYDLLNDQEKTFLLRLSVFAGGWTLDAAEAVCAEEATSQAPESDSDGDQISAAEVLDLLTSLVDKSLVVFMESVSSSRYRLLETVRQYSREKLLLRTGESETTRGRHRDFYLGLTQSLEAKLTGAEQVTALRLLDNELENLRASLEWSLLEPGAQNALRLCGSLSRFWWTRGHLTEGREWCGRALAKKECDEPAPAALAKALNGAGVLAAMQGDYAVARAYWLDSLEMLRDIGDLQAVASALNNLGNIANRQDDYNAARDYYEQSLALRRDIGDRKGISDSLICLGAVAFSQGDYDRAQVLYDQALQIRRDIGDRKGIADALNSLGGIFFTRGELDAVGPIYTESLAIQREIGDPHSIAISLNNIGLLEYNQGNYAAARSHFQDSLELKQQIGDRRGVAISFGDLGNVACAEGKPDAAREYYRDSLVIQTEIGDRSRIAGLLGAFAGLALKENNPARAAKLFGSAEAIREQIGIPVLPNELKAYERDVAALQTILGEADFRSAWEIGRTMTLQQAVEYVGVLPVC